MKNKHKKAAIFFEVATTTRKKKTGINIDDNRVQQKPASYNNK